MNEKLLGLLRRQSWLLTDQFERATTAQQKAHDAKTAYPFSQEQMIELELDMLRAQIELERADNAEPVKPA